MFGWPMSATRAVLLAILVVALAGCSSISSGTVTGKKYIPEITVYVPTCLSYDSKGLCTVMMPMRSCGESFVASVWMAESPLRCE